MLREKLKFIDDFLSTELVDDADQGVRNGYDDKKHVFITADRCDHEGKDEVDKIEEGEGVFGDDFPGRAVHLRMPFLKVDNR